VYSLLAKNPQQERIEIRQHRVVGAGVPHMHRHNIALLSLAAVIAVCFPILYQTHAAQHPTVVMPLSVARGPVLETVGVQQSVRTEEKRVHDIQTDTVPETTIKKPEEKVVAKKILEKTISKSQTVEKVVSSPKPEVQFTKTTIENEKQPGSTPTQLLASEIHRQTNQIRREAGLSPLRYDRELEAIASKHSEDMLSRDYLAHESPDGCDVTCRVTRAGYQALYWGENIIWIEASVLPEHESLAASFMDSWMGSGGHRKNILSADYTHAGIGVAVDEGVAYVTVNFAQPK
jgi:uncharacterized protein YkwD